MNEFISPHQNININISYNLGQQQKIPKVVFGKKIAKIVKSTTKDYKDYPQAFYKTFKKNHQYIPTQQEPKKQKSSKNMKTKKKSNNLVTMPDQEIIMPRRLKTEGNAKPQIMNSVFKKQPKTHTKSVFQKPATQHSKSLNNPIPISQNLKTLQIKKSTNKLKKQKQQRRNYNKSCILYQPKKHILLSDIEHIVSTTTNGPTPTNKQANQTHNKKRVNSVNVMRSDKFINKLLDMSVLTSQLGGTMPVNDEENTNIRQRSRQNINNNKMKSSLQDFMNSIDLRIIKKMEQDNKNKKNVLKDFNIGQGMELIAFLNKIKRIPMDKLNEKAIKIQRFWRKKTGQSVIPYYSNMFFRNPIINSKAAIQSNLQDISDINIKTGELDVEISDNHESFMRSSKGKTKEKEEKGDIFQFVSAARVSSSKTQVEDEYISTAKINKMFEATSGMKDVNVKDNQSKKYEIFQEDDESEQEQLSSEDERIEIEVEKSLEQEVEHNKEEDSNEQAQQKNTKSLNIQKYKQLVRQSIEKSKLTKEKGSKNISPAPQKQFYSIGVRQQQKQSSKTSSTVPKVDPKSVQSAQWNHVHNILSSNMNKKVPIMPKNVLEELMKQSAYNKQWVQGEFSNSESRKMSSKSSPRDIRESDNGIQTIQQQEKSEKEGKMRKHNQKLEIKHATKQEEQFVNDSPSPKLNERKISQEEDHYNWNKYSDISRLKKPQQIITKSKEPIHKGLQKKQKYEHQDDEQDFQSYQLNGNRKHKSLLPGLLPKGINIFTGEDLSNIQQESDQQEKTLPKSFTFEKRPLSQKQKNYEHNKGNEMIDSMEDIYNQSLEKDSKWIREKMVMEDGIVEKYLDCGLDNFGLHLSKSGKSEVPSQNLNESQKGDFINEQQINQIERQQQKQVQQPKQHRATLQKQPHRTTLSPKSPQIKISESEKQPQPEQVDIFSNQQPQNNHDQDKQLVYVFQNINNKAMDIQKLYQNSITSELNPNKDISLENAVKNSKRNDTQNHLGYRDQDTNEFVDVSNEENSKKTKIIEQQSQELPTGFKNKKYKQFIPPQHTNSHYPKQSQQIPLFEPSYKTRPPASKNPINLQQFQEIDLSAEEEAIKQEINNKRIQKVTETIIAKLIEEFAYDVSIILRKNQAHGHSQGNSFELSSKKQSKNNISNQNPPANANNLLGIQTNFQNIRDFITKLKQFILSNQQYSKKMIQNLKNNIGPTSMQILSYLRVQQPPQFVQNGSYNADQAQQEMNDQWLFVIPNDLFEVFNKKLLDQEETSRNKKLSNRFKLYTEFWHRSIFQSYNQCLDFQRPYGITGAPYIWVTQAKLPHQIKYSKQKVQEILQNAEGRLLELSSSTAGIIFDKPDSPYREFDLNDQSKIQLNQQRISRMLANQILDDEYNWITYHDEVTELMVDISRKIQELLVFQVSTDVKKIMRRRKMMVHVSKAIKKYQGNMNEGHEEESLDEDQHATFMVEDLI